MQLQAAAELQGWRMRLQGSTSVLLAETHEISRSHVRICLVSGSGPSKQVQPKRRALAMHCKCVHGPGRRARTRGGTLLSHRARADAHHQLTCSTSKEAASPLCACAHCSSPAATCKGGGWGCRKAPACYSRGHMKSAGATYAFASAQWTAQTNQLGQSAEQPRHTANA